MRGTESDARLAELEVRVAVRRAHRGELIDWLMAMNAAASKVRRLLYAGIVLLLMLPGLPWIADTLFTVVLLLVVLLLARFFVLVTVKCFERGIASDMAEIAHRKAKGKISP